MEVNKIKCEHCGGTGKCQCFECVDKAFNIIVNTDDTEEALDEYDKIKERGIDVFCSICNGFGFLYQKENGEIVAPKRKSD